MTSNNDKQAIITDIRSRVQKEATPLYPTGTIVRFKHKTLGGKKLQYAALFASKRWWTTAMNREATVRDIQSIYSNDGFMKLLSAPETSKVEIATEFEAL